jgi:hypothetical protein
MLPILEAPLGGMLVTRHLKDFDCIVMTLRWRLKTKLNSGFRCNCALYEYSTTISERISFHLMEKYQQIGLSGRGVFTGQSPKPLTPLENVAAFALDMRSSSSTCPA